MVGWGSRDISGSPANPSETLLILIGVKCVFSWWQSNAKIPSAVCHWRKKCYICTRKPRIWEIKLPYLSCCWAFCCSFLRVRQTGRRGPNGRPSVRWRRWKSGRRSSTRRLSRRTTNTRQKRPKGWSKKTKGALKGCVAGSGAIRFSPNSNRFSSNSGQKIQFFDLFFASTSKKSKKSENFLISINDYISKCWIEFQDFLEEKNAENEFFSCVLSKKVVILTTFNALNKVV